MIYGDLAALSVRAGEVLEAGDDAYVFPNASGVFWMRSRTQSRDSAARNGRPLRTRVPARQS